MFSWHQLVSQHIDSNLRLLKVDTRHPRQVPYSMNIISLKVLWNPSKGFLELRRITYFNLDHDTPHIRNPPINLLFQLTQKVTLKDFRRQRDDLHEMLTA